MGIKPTRVFVFLLVHIILSGLIHAAVYGTDMESVTRLTLADSIFVIAVLTFFPSLALKIGSTNVLLGLRYSLYRLINAKKPQDFDSFKDYYEAKSLEVKSTVVNDLMIVALTFMVLAFYLGFTWTP